MNYDDTRQEFIQVWGSLATSWGVSKTMASIHAYLLSSAEPMTTDDIMEDLQISRGNANMNVRALVDWGLVRKVSIAGERMDHYEADKDVHSFAPKIARERRKRELEPVIEQLKTLRQVEGRGADAKELKKTLTGIYDFASLGDQFLRRYIQGDKGWLTRTLSKFLK